MKKNNNIKQLKELVNNSVAELVRLHVDGVQAYNISNNEYEVIMKFEKIRGRYYFIDRDNNKYLASSYDRAEFVAGEILERVAEEAATVKAAADSIAEKGEATINFDLFVSYIYECEARGINHGELVDRTEDAAGTMYNVYRIESAQDEQQGENDGENEETATTCEPSALSGILAKMKDGARKVCEKVAFAMFCCVVGIVTLSALYFSIVGLGELLDILGVEGGTWAACALALLLFPTVILEFVFSVEQNTMAAFDHLFPSLFKDCERVKFSLPFTFWYRLIKQGRI